MTSKDYIKIAEVCKATKPDFGMVKGVQWRWMVRRLATMCHLDNNRFNEDKFFKACGMERKGN